MRILRVIVLALLPLLFACLPKKTEVQLMEIPAGPLAQALEERRAAFVGLKVLASAEMFRSGRKRSYENVGIMLDGLHRFRMEAFGPLGQSLAVLLWNGRELLLRTDDGRIVRPDAAGLEKIFGIALDAAELCAVLSANVPGTAPLAAARAFREPDGGLQVEFADGADRRRYFLRPLEIVSGHEVRITASELSRSGALVYRARYPRMERVSGYLIPKAVKIENPEKKALFTVEYADVDMNVPLPDEAFSLTGGEPGAP